MTNSATRMRTRSSKFLRRNKRISNDDGGLKTWHVLSPRYVFLIFFSLLINDYLQVHHRCWWQTIGNTNTQHQQQLICFSLLMITYRYTMNNDNEGMATLTPNTSNNEWWDPRCVTSQAPGMFSYFLQVHYEWHQWWTNGYTKHYYTSNNEWQGLRHDGMYENINGDSRCEHVSSLW